MDNTDIYRKSRFGKKWLWITAVIVFCLVLGIRYSMTTAPVHKYVKNKIVSAADRQLKVSLSVEKLSGDLWREINLENISFVKDGKVVASVDSMRLSYNILSYFSSSFEINKWSVYGPTAHIKQRDTGWNVAEWVEPPADQKGEKAEFPLTITLFQIEQGKVEASMDVPGNDSVSILSEIKLRSQLSSRRDGFEWGISDLSFVLEGIGLERPLNLQAQGRGTENRITLEKMILSTAYSYLQTSGEVNFEDSTSQIRMEAQSVSSRDISKLSGSFAIKQDLNAELILSGRGERYDIGLTLHSDDIQGAELNAHVNWKEGPVLRSLKMDARKVDLSSSLEDASLPVLENISLHSQGKMPLDDLKNGSARVSFEAGVIRNHTYSLDGISGEFSLDNQLLEGNFTAKAGVQHLKAGFTAENPWSGNPQVEITAKGQNINPAYWLQEERFKGSVNFTASGAGRGIRPRHSPWDYKVKVRDAKLFRQHISDASLEGTFSMDRFTGESTVRFKNSRINLKAEADHLQDVPEFSYQISTTDFDLSEFRKLKSFSTAITGIIKGTGSGSSFQDLSLSSSVSVDPSVINGEMVEHLDAEVTFRDSVLTVRDAELRSIIADGRFDARVNLLELYSPANSLDINIEVKDPGALAPLFNSDKLRAEGNIDGQLSPEADGRLKFSGKVALSGLNYGNDFKAEKAEGMIAVKVTEHPSYTTNLQLSSPSFYGVGLQDFKLNSSGEISDSRAEGTFHLTFTGSREGTIDHRGSYMASEDSIAVLTDSLRMENGERTLELQEPFSLLVEGGAVAIDTLRLSGPEEASLKMAAVYEDSVHQRGYLKAEKMNITLIQQLLLKKSYAEGILSGELDIDRELEALTVRGKLQIADIRYKETNFDMLDLSLGIEENLMNGIIVLREGEKKVIEGELSLPFRMGDPLTFDESFFEQRVEGSLQVNRLDLDRIKVLLKEESILDTEGILTINGEMGGSLGKPKIEGKLVVDKAVLSGVGIDSVTGSLQYLHEDSELQIQTTVGPSNRILADVQANIPFRMNLRELSLRLPGRQDSIRVSMETNNFNLAALNDFMNPETVQQIKGELNGSVQLSGQSRDLKTDGELQLSNGSIRIVKAGIKIENIQSRLIFEPNRLHIASLRGKSKSGDMNVKGDVVLEQLVPDRINLQLKANNFTVVNTPAYRAAVNMDATMKGSLANPRISGRMKLVSGFIEMSNFGEKSVENVDLKNREGSELLDKALYESLAVDMDILFDRRFYLRSSRFLKMEIELKGSLDLLKEKNEEPRLFGSLSPARGYAAPLGKEFRLDEGEVTFSGELTNPSLNIKTLYLPPQPKQEIKIWYIIEGTVEEPKFSYESSPPMELDNIISYTLFGKPFYELESWQQVVTNSGSGSTATNVAMDVLMDRVESLASQKLGIDVVKIDHTMVGGRNGTSITTGWYINPKVFFAIQNIVSGTSPDTSFQLEYLLSRSLKLIISQGNNTHQGIDLNWNYEY